MTNISEIHELSEFDRDDASTAQFLIETLNAIEQGVAVWDAARRLVAWNQTFQDVYASVKGFCLKAYRYLKFLQSVPVKVCLVLVRLRFWPRSASMKLKTKTSTRLRKSNTATADVLRCVNIRCRRAGMSRYSPT